jgi:hypothetical protein
MGQPSNKFGFCTYFPYAELLFWVGRQMSLFVNIDSLADRQAPRMHL